MTKKWLWTAAGIALIAASCDSAKPPQEDKAKQAVKEVITREFQYYKGAKEKIGENQKQEEQRREQEKQLE